MTILNAIQNLIQVINYNILIHFKKKSLNHFNLFKKINTTSNQLFLRFLISHTVYINKDL